MKVKKKKNQKSLKKSFNHSKKLKIKNININLINNKKLKKIINKQY